MTRALTLALVLLAAGPIAAQQGPPAPPAPMDPAALRALGARTTKQLAARAAEWTSYYAVRSDYVVVHVLQAPPGRRAIDVSIEREGARTPVLHILERDGAWLVAEAEGANGAWRAWEAPLRLNFLLGPIDHALHPESMADVTGDLGTFDGVKDGVAQWSLPSPDKALLAFGKEQELLRAWVGDDAARRADPRTKARIRGLGRLEHELEEGILTRVDVATGLVTMAGLPGARRALGGFAWRDAVPDETFGPAGVTPPVDGRGDPLAVASVEDLVLIGSCGYWTAEAAEGDPSAFVLDARLVDLRAHTTRRLPVPGAAVTAGAWSRDRTRVYAVTSDGPPLELELRSGRRRPLGGAALAAGRCAFPALSPDGRTLAVVHQPPDGPRRVMLVEVAGEATARPLGPPLDAGCLSWLGGGALLLVRRGPDGQRVCTLGPDGALTVLRPGSAPVALADGASMLFLDLTSGLWSTAPVTPGSPATPFVDGLQGDASPALSPDGKRVLFVDGASGQPVVYDLVTGERVLHPLGPGLWGQAVWR